jgi:hypothetical protein
MSFAATVAGVDMPENTGLTNIKIAKILENVLNWLLGVIGIIALISFVISGGQYMLASGDDKLMENGKRNMLYSIIGMIVVLGSFVVIQAIDSMLSGSSTW